MSDAGFIALIAASAVTVLGSATGATFASYTKRRDDKDRRTGERMGKLESEADYQRGYREGFREGVRSVRKGRPAADDPSGEGVS